MEAGVIVAEVRDAAGMSAVVQRLGITTMAQTGKAATFLVKPAWFSPHRANFTGARELDLLLSCLPAGRRIIVEGYSGARNFGGREVTPENARANWDWIKEQDQVFRDATGISDVLARHGAEYLNVTEEIWRGRAAPAATVRRIVEETYPRAVAPPVAQEALFGVIPQRLLDLRGTVLISYARLKSGSAGTGPTGECWAGASPTSPPYIGPSSGWWASSRDYTQQLSTARADGTTPPGATTTSSATPAWSWPAGRS